MKLHTTPSHRGSYRKRRRGFTLVEVLTAILIVAVLIALAFFWHQRSLEKVRATEAVGHLNQIRTAEFAYQATHGTFTEAADTPAVESTLNVQMTSPRFEYHVEQPAADAFLAIATQKVPPSNPPQEPLVVTMDHTGRLDYRWPSRPVTSPSPTGRIRSSPGGGGSTAGISTGGVGGISGGGGRTLGGPTGGSPGGGSGGSGGGTDPGSSTPPDNPAPGGGFVLPPLDPAQIHAPSTFTLIARGDDLWDDWPDTNQKNIAGSQGTALLSSAFDLVAASGASAISNDLYRKGIPISFDASFFGGTGLCGSAYACFVSYTGFLPPLAPGLLPQLYFNPFFLGEDAEAIAAVLVHEGTHFQQYLDGTTFHRRAGTITTVDTEFTAFWNAAVYWGGVRAGQIPVSSFLEDDLESLYQLALQGEAQLRNEIAARY